MAAKLQGFTEAGNTTLTITGAAGTITRKVQGSYPSCLITVYDAGTTDLATIYSDNSSTPKANPFTAASDGTWFFYAIDGRYDVRFSGAGIATPFTLGDFLFWDNLALDGNDLLAPSWVPISANPIMRATEYGSVPDYNVPTSDNITSMRPAIWLNLDADTNPKQGLFINIKKKTTAAPLRYLSGIYVDSYFPPDNGGDVSGVHVINTGSGDAISAFNFKALRPAGYALQSGGFAGEFGTDSGAGVIIATQDNDVDSVLFDAQALIINLGGTGANQTGLQIVNTTDNPTPPSTQAAILVSNPAGTDNRFRVELATGNTQIKGDLTMVAGTITLSNAKALGLLGTSAGRGGYLACSNTDYLELGGAFVGTRILNHAATIELFKVLDNGQIAISKTSNQLVTGTSPNTQVQNFPGTTGVLTYPSTTATILGYSGTEATVGGAGGASALPATPVGYLQFYIGATLYKIPYYLNA